MNKLKLLLVPLLISILFASGARPAHAGIFKIWDDIKCVADIDCTVTAASTAAMNFIAKVVTGETQKGLEGISVEDVDSMLAGTWDRGLAVGMGKVAAVAYSYPPPIRFKEFVQLELADNIFNSQAQAQTLGNEALSPISPFWSGMRNTAYGLFLIVMIAIGFMIILQKEISPRVVITFTSALPKILLGLVLMTFSLPIIALIVDFAAVFGSNLVLGFIANLVKEFTTNVGGIAQSIGVFPAFLIGAIISSIGAAINGVGGMVLVIIMFVATLALFGLVIIRLFTTYAWILVYTIFSPLIFLFGSLPGQEGAISKFLKQLVSKALVFPAILLFLALALFFMQASLSRGIVAALTADGLVSFVGTTIFYSIMGPILALIMMAAAFKAPALIDEVLGLSGPPKKK